MRIMFVAGGTGGHINPAVAVATEIRRLDPTSEILFVGTEGRMETQIVPKAGFEIKALFDANPRLIGLKIREFEVLDSEIIEEFVKDNNIDIAIICIPKKTLLLLRNRTCRQSSAQIRKE